MKKTFYAVKTEKGKGGIRCVMISDKGSVFTGKAICSDTDNFSMALGMEIAEKRAKLKQLNRIYGNVQKMRTDFSRKLNQIENRETKLFDKIWTLEDELETLCYSVNEESGE